jgi:hypothetical protein
MKRSVFLVAVILVLFAGFQDSASAQPYANLIVRGDINDLEVSLRPWKLEIPVGADLGVRLIDATQNQLTVTKIGINNTDKACFDPNAPIDVEVGVSPPVTVVVATPPPSLPNNTWCGYNIVLTIAVTTGTGTQTETVTIDPDFRIR